MEYNILLGRLVWNILLLYLSIVHCNVQGINVRGKNEFD